MDVRRTATIIALTASLGGLPAWGQSDSEQKSAEHTEAKWEQRVSDAWINGKLETVYALNRHLNPFKIDTNVNNGMVTLTGTVESDIDRDLAEELAKGIEGVKSVENELRVDTTAARESEQKDSSGDSQRRKFGQWVDDTTTTAAVKSKLMANSNIKGTSINVDTRYDVVTLRGEVDSSEEKSLAEQLARNTGDVADVRNELKVKSGS